MTVISKTFVMCFFFSVFLLTGCISKDIQVYSTKSWEGHFFDVEEAKQKLDNAELSKGESIWILSNKTFTRVILENWKEN